MTVGVTSAGGTLSSAQRDRAVRQVLLALSRFGRRVHRVTIRLAAPKNPLGGVDQRCRMRASLVSADEIRAEALDGTIDEAVARAAAQLAKRVGRALQDGGRRTG